MLAVVFALEKWHQFVFGRHVVVRTDHKPLEAITKKPLDKAPRRLQGMLLRSLAYDIDVQYIPGRTQHLADIVMTETFFCESYMTCTAGDMFRSHYREHMVFF